MENLFEILVQRGALARVEDGVVGEVRRSIGLVGRDQTNEFLLRHGLQGVVQAPLISERRDRVGGKLLSAQRAGAVGRVDQGLVGKRQEFVVERVVKVCAEVVGCPPERGAQVGAADIADKQRVAGEDGVRLCRVLLQIEDQDRDGLDGVAGGFEDLQAQSREVERIAVLHGHESVFRLGAGAEMDGRAATVAQFQMAGDEVGMEVGQEDVADLEAEFLGVGQVLLDVALRIDDDGGRAGLVSEQIGGVGQAAQVVLFQNHEISQPALHCPKRKCSTLPGKSAELIDILPSCPAAIFSYAKW